MSVDSTSLRPKGAPPDPARADGSYGFVPAAEIRNVWVEAIRRLDQEKVLGKVAPKPKVDEQQAAMSQAAQSAYYARMAKHKG